MSAAPRQALPHPVLLEAPDIGRWEDGNTGVAYVHAFDSGQPGPDVLLTALVHGNEYAGARVLCDLLALEFRPDRGRLTLAFCNVAAFQRFDRCRPDASRFVDEDMNRVWSPARLLGPEESAELVRARELLPFVERCTHLLDLHSMHEPAPPLLVTGPLAHDIRFAQALGCSGQVMVDEGHADGVRMRDYESGRRVSLLLEAGQHWDPQSECVARDVTMRFLASAGAIAAERVIADWTIPAPPSLPAVHVTHRVVARSADFAFLGQWRGGEVIARAGTPIARDGAEVVRTPYDECVLVMPSLRQLAPGVTTVRLGRMGTAPEGVAPPS